MKEKEYAKDYMSLEMMAVAAARQIKDREVIFVGTGLPMLASMLALFSHAPHAVILYESGYIGCRNIHTARLIGDIRLMYNLAQLTKMVDVLSHLQRGRVDVGFVGGAQCDKYGNVNSTVIGDYWKPTVRLPGAGGANALASLTKRILIVMNHELRRFPEKVDYVTSPGWVSGSDSRRKAGLRWGGPDKVITDKAILGFEQESKEMMLISVHPGITVKQVQENTGFELIMPEKVQVTKPPTVEELRVLREKVDPTGFYLIRRVRKQLKPKS